MPWSQGNVGEQRRSFVSRAVSGKETLTALCREFGIARSTGTIWRDRWREQKQAGALGERSRRPHHSPRLTPAEVERRVVELRRETGWGARKLQVELKEKFGLQIPESTLNRIIFRQGLVHAESSTSPAVKRFERAAPNLLWQMDFKGEYAVLNGKCYPLTLIDDHSRYLIGLEAQERPDYETTMQTLIGAFERCGLPDAILTDHGTPWWSTTNGAGLTRLSVALMNQDVRLYYSRIRHPQTQGKVERLHRTLKQDLRYHGLPTRMPEFRVRLAEFRQSYNERRPHEALGMRKPVELWHPSGRAYQPQPAEYEYPLEYRKFRLNGQGAITVKGERYFVSEALAGEVVGWVEIGDQWMIRYRRMFIRQIDPASGRTAAAILPAD